MPDDDAKKIMVSAVALVTGNSVVDDLWTKYFPELEELGPVSRDILINAHVQAITGRRRQMKVFMRFIESETRWKESTIGNAIRDLRKIEMIRDGYDEADARITYVLPSQDAKERLIKMGNEYAGMMHSPITSLLGKDFATQGELVDDIQHILNSNICDY